MLLIFVFILLIVGIGILVSVYSVFFPFIKNLGEISNYNTAYYGAVSSVERAELALKYKLPGFEWSGGYMSGNNRWPKSDYKTWSFGFINSGAAGGMYRQIISKTNRIPNVWEGNVEYLLASEGSDDFNMLDYQTPEKFILSYDNSASDTAYTTTTNLSGFDGSFTGLIRLPPKVASGYGGDAALCTSLACDTNGDHVADDIIVDRSLEWNSNGMYFKIVPYISVLYYSGMFVDTYKDIAIRKSVINQTGKLYFGEANFNPIDNANYASNNLTWHVVIANNPSAVTTVPFDDLLSSVTWLELNLGLINLLSTTNQIYPFLEYRFGFSSDVSDRFYTIKWNARVGEYDVQVIVKKPTSQWSTAWSFTVIF